MRSQIRSRKEKVKGVLLDCVGWAEEKKRTIESDGEREREEVRNKDE